MRNLRNTENNNQSVKVWMGAIIVAVGGLLLLDNMGLDLPNWLFKWHTFLMLIGIYIGAKQNFRNSSWLVVFLIGAYFTLNRALPDLNMSEVVFPIMLVVLGLFLIFKPKNRFRRWKRGYEESENFQPYTDVTVEATADHKTDHKVKDSNDYIDSVNVFGGSHQAVYSKNFKGGEVIAVFGGCDVNLTQADFEGQIKIEVIAIFGGAKIIIPPGWEVKSEVTAIFGGLDDKRAIQPIADGTPRKLVIIEGLALFGGVDIRNY